MACATAPTSKNTARPVPKEMAHLVAYLGEGEVSCLFRVSPQSGLANGSKRRPTERDALLCPKARCFCGLRIFAEQGGSRIQNRRTDGVRCSVVPDRRGEGLPHAPWVSAAWPIQLLCKTYLRQTSEMRAMHSFWAPVRSPGVFFLSLRPTTCCPSKD